MTPSPIRTLYRTLLSETQRGRLRVALGRAPRERYSRNETTFNERAQLAPLVTDVFHRIRRFPGWFTYDDCASFALVLNMQHALGVRGDILEIGTFYGRSTAMLATCLGNDERLLACDPFETETTFGYENPPTKEIVERNVAEVAPDAHFELVKANSRNLSLDNRVFRFIHIDGSHDYDDVAHDLRLAAEHLAEKGVIVMDDYEHPEFPDVKRVVDDLRADLTLVDIADLNRHAEPGRKLYLARQATPPDRSATY